MDKTHEHSGEKSSKPHRNLMAWQEGMRLVEAIYELTRSFPKEEAFGLTSQLRRAAVSVPSNLAEGAANRETDHFRNHVRIALGSLNEIDTQLELAFRLHLANGTQIEKVRVLLDHCLALTYGLKKSLA